jgi:hypothetical protein
MHQGDISNGLCANNTHAHKGRPELPPGYTSGGQQSARCIPGRITMQPYQIRTGVAYGAPDNHHRSFSGAASHAPYVALSTSLMHVWLSGTIRAPSRTPLRGGTVVRPAGFPTTRKVSVGALQYTSTEAANSLPHLAVVKFQITPEAGVVPNAFDARTCQK